MHVALVTETHVPEVNGVALTVQRLAEGLRALGVNVEVVRPTQAGESPGEEVTGIRVPGRALPCYPGLRFGLPAATLLRRRWRQVRPDAVYVATEGPLGWSALSAARSLGIAVATGFHTRFDHYLSRYGLGMLSPVAFAWLRHFHNRGDATIVPTRALMQELGGRGFRRLAWLPRAVDVATFSPRWRSMALRDRWGVGDEGLAVLHVGRLAPEKNLPLLSRAYSAIRRRQPEARLIVVGDGPEREALAAAHPEAEFTGVLRGQQLAAHFSSADMFLFPSLSETFGNVTLEAMASGVPVVAFDYGAAGEHLRDGVHGRAVPCDAEEAFVEAALALAGDPEGRQRMGAAARQGVAAMSPDRVCLEFAEMLSGLALREQPWPA